MYAHILPEVLPPLPGPKKLQKQKFLYRKHDTNLQVAFWSLSTLPKCMLISSPKYSPPPGTKKAPKTEISI
jgi:hypothetical protein